MVTATIGRCWRDHAKITWRSRSGTAVAGQDAEKAKRITPTVVLEAFFYYTGIFDCVPFSRVVIEPTSP